METVFISGADKGLGCSLAGRFLKGGFRVFAGAYVGSAGLSDLSKGFPETLTIIPLDVTEMESVVQAARTVAEHSSALDILINNAGVNLEDDVTPLEKLDLADLCLEKTMEVNAFGPLRLTQQFCSLLRAGRRKLLINISSEAGSVGDAQRRSMFAYCMSKAALNMQSKLLQNYLGPEGFRVLAVHPGWMRTDMGGAGAHIAPEQAADGIFKLAMRMWAAEDWMYLDYQGKALNW